MGSRRIAKTRSLSSYLSSVNQTSSTALIRSSSTDGIATNAIGEDAISEDLQLFSKSIASGNYVEGYSGWKIDGTGNAEFGNVVVRGDINASSGTIGYWNISNPAVIRTIGDKTLLGTFLESGDTLGSTDVGVTGLGSYVGLYKSYSPDPLQVTDRVRTSNVSTITVPGHEFVPGDYVVVTLDDNTTFNNGGSPVLVDSITNDTVTYANYGSNVTSSTANTIGIVQLYNPDTAGLYLKDYSQVDFDYGWFSNRGIAYASAKDINFLYNPSFEYGSPTPTASGASWTYNSSTATTIQFSTISRSPFTTKPAAKSAYAANVSFSSSALTAPLIGTINYSEVFNNGYTTNKKTLNMSFDVFPIYTPIGFTVTAATANTTHSVITVSTNPSTIAIGDTLYVDVFTVDTNGDDFIFGVRTVTAVKNTSPYQITFLHGVGYAPTGALSLSDNYSYDGTSRARTVYEVPKGFALNLKEIKFDFGNGSTAVPLANVVTTNYLATWGSDPQSYHYHIDTLNLSNLMADNSVQAASYDVLTTNGENNVIQIDPSKLYAEYAAKNPTGLAALSDIKVQIPTWGYTAQANVTSGLIEISAVTKVTSPYSFTLLYDSFNFGTSASAFYGSMSASENSSFSWKDGSGPSSVSYQAGTEWLHVDLESNTATLDNFNYIGLASDYSGIMTSRPYISSLSLLDFESRPDRSIIEYDQAYDLGTISDAVWNSLYIFGNSGVEKSTTTVSGGYLQYTDPSPKTYTDLLGVTYTSSTLKFNSYTNYIVAAGQSATEVIASKTYFDNTGWQFREVVAGVTPHITTDDNPRVKIQGQLYVQNRNNTISLTSKNNPIQIGSSSEAHMKFTAARIQAQAKSGTVASLYLNNLGGSVVIGTTTVGLGVINGSYVWANGVYGNTLSTAYRSVYVSSTGTYDQLGYVASSRRYKKDIEPLSYTAEQILSVAPVQYRYNEEDETAPMHAGMIAEDMHDAGLHGFISYDSEGLPQTINYEFYVSALQQVVRDLQRQINELRDQVNG